jgi:hypothetical protein
MAIACCTAPTIIGSPTFVVSAEPHVEVVGFTDVQRVIGTPDNVDEPHTTTMPSSAERIKVRSLRLE